MLAGFSVIVSSGITLVVGLLPFFPTLFLVFSPLAQIFFPRSIETEIAAHDAGARSRVLFSSRHHLTLISQEQELCGTYVYDPEDTPVDGNGVSPSPLYYKPAAFPPSDSPSRDDIYAPAYLPQQSGAPPPPPPPTQPPPTEPIRLTPNRLQSSVEGISPPPARKQQQQQPPLPSSLADRFNNPASSVSRLEQSFRTPICT